MELPEEKPLLRTKKKERSSFTNKTTRFCSEFNPDSNHVISFQKLWGRENYLTTTCPLGLGLDFSDRKIRSLIDLRSYGKINFP